MPCGDKDVIYWSSGLLVLLGLPGLHYFPVILVMVFCISLVCKGILHHKLYRLFRFLGSSGWNRFCRLYRTLDHIPWGKNICLHMRKQMIKSIIKTTPVMFLLLCYFNLINKMNKYIYFKPGLRITWSP